MGEEADYLESQSDEGAYEDMRQIELEERRRRKTDLRNFKESVKREVTKQLRKHGIEPKQYKPRGKMVDKICACGCGRKFQAREADVKRGWGRFASKSCAAIFKDKKTGGINRSQYGL